MTEGNRDNGKYNAANEAWSKNWLVPILLLMLRQWSSYGYELMEKMSTFGLVAMNPGTPARRMYSITDAGEAYLNYWAESLNQYQRMMDTFFRLYTGQPTPREKKDQK